MDPHHLRDRQTKEAQRQGRQDELQIIGFSVEGGLEDGRGSVFFSPDKTQRIQMSQVLFGMQIIHGCKWASGVVAANNQVV